MITNSVGGSGRLILGLKLVGTMVMVTLAISLAMAVMLITLAALVGAP